MNPSVQPPLPTWVAPFCCTAPFCALIALSISAPFGTSVSTPCLVCLVLLCGRITGWVLNVPARFPLPTRVGNGK